MSSGKNKGTNQKVVPMKKESKKLFTTAEERLEMKNNDLEVQLVNTQYSSEIRRLTAEKAATVSKIEGRLGVTLAACKVDLTTGEITAVEDPSLPN